MILRPTTNECSYLTFLFFFFFFFSVGRKYLWLLLFHCNFRTNCRQLVVTIGNYWGCFEESYWFKGKRATCMNSVFFKTYKWGWNNEHWNTKKNLAFIWHLYKPYWAFTLTAKLFSMWIQFPLNEGWQFSMTQVFSFLTCLSFSQLAELEEGEVAQCCSFSAG